VFGAGQVWAQAPVDSSAGGNELAPNIYLDCGYCDHDFFRTEISFVNFVRDRQLADVHVLVSQRRTAAGGSEYTIEMIGRERFGGMTDTLTVITQPSATDDDVRKLLLQKVKLGAMRFLARTPVGGRVTISDTQTAEPKKVKDKWNYWVFRVAVDSWINGDNNYRDLYVYSQISANRITEMNKIETMIWGSYDEDKYEYGDYKALNVARSKGAQGYIILGIDNHWSAGGGGSVYASIFSNRDISFTFFPSAEYNIFSYKESTRRQARIIYELTGRYVDYVEETIYNKLNEWLWSEQLRLEVGLIQPWGSVNASISGAHYFHDFKKYRIMLYTQLSLRVVEGLSFNVSGTFSHIRDQLSLAKGDASTEDILLKRRELETNYSYWVNFGLSYTFGSIYTNIVNPRFGN